MKGQDAGMRRYNYLLGELEAVYHGISLQMGLSDSISRILYAICDQGDRCPLSLVCRRTGLTKQTVNSALRRLEEKGLVRLEAVDGRAKEVCFTEEGRALADRTARKILEMENRVLESWAPGEVARYLELTERFLRSMEQQAARLEAQGEEGE